VNRPEDAMRLRLFSLVGLLTGALSASAMEVKGLKLGTIYTQEEASEILRSRLWCPTEEQRRSELRYKRGTCEAPITYLGFETTIRLDVDEVGRLSRIQIYVPDESIPEIEKLFDSKYGARVMTRGDVKRFGRGKKDTYVTNCSKWEGVQDSDIVVCTKSIGQPASVAFNHHPGGKIDATDT
jgi:hypothetical protein